MGGVGRSHRTISDNVLRATRKVVMGDVGAHVKRVQSSHGDLRREAS